MEKVNQYSLKICGEIESIFDRDTKVENVKSGFVFTEGPVWHEADHCLYFNDVPESVTYRYATHHGLQRLRFPNNKSNGMSIDRDGEILVCEHETRRVIKFHRGSKNEVIIADHFGGKKFNSPNDIVVSSQGGIYFTDPPYGLNQKFGTEGEPEYSFSGVFYVDPSRREAQCVTSSLFRPNGLCLSPDESMLYINDSEHGFIKVFHVNRDGSLENERIFAEVKGEKKGVPDGMKTDSSGNIWVTGPGGLWIFNAEGLKLGEIGVPEFAANFCFGDEDRKSIYITATTSLYRIRSLISMR